MAGLFLFGFPGPSRPSRWIVLTPRSTFSRPSCTREDGSIIPRNSFVGDPIHRVDMRLQQRIPLGGRAGLDGIFEVFNLFDRANFGSYDLDESSATFLHPQQNANLAYAPRTLQLGFRFTC